jgi:hypothetical protein
VFSTSWDSIASYTVCKTGAVMPTPTVLSKSRNEIGKVPTCLLCLISGGYFSHDNCTQIKDGMVSLQGLLLSIEGFKQRNGGR